jgi:Fe-S-cluster containining protein
MDALRFTCVPGCTKCCDRPGYVYLTEADLGAAARHLGLGRREFERRYVYRTRHLLRLRKPRGRQCHFLEAGGCGLHPDKPTQCRLFPFWPELVESVREWRREVRACPGMGQGELVQIGTSHEIASEMKRAYPSLYKD